MAKGMAGLSGERSVAPMMHHGAFKTGTKELGGSLGRSLAGVMRGSRPWHAIAWSAQVRCNPAGGSDGVLVQVSNGQPLDSALLGHVL